MIETTVIRKCKARSPDQKNKDGDIIGGLCHLTGKLERCNIYDSHNCKLFLDWQMKSEECKKLPAHVTSNWEKDQLFFTNREEYIKKFGGK